MQAPLQARNDSDATRTDTVRTVAQKRVLADNRPKAAAQRKLAEMMNNSARVLQQRALSDAIHNSPRMVAQRHQMDAVFGGAVKPQRDGAIPAEALPAQREGKTNNTGLPNQLKSGIESLSGMSMDHIKVHYNSDRPAQLQAHAYAQGNEIHLGAGQERHLPHEAWHVVQQAQGRVRPTLQMNAGAVNDDPSLESEADRMGEKAAQFKGRQVARSLALEKCAEGGLTQRVPGFELSPGQERHVPHEAWHVVQQAQGRVQSTMPAKQGAAINDGAGLEREADLMGAEALRAAPGGRQGPPSARNHAAGAVAQRVRFSNTNSFYGNQEDAASLAPPLVEALEPHRGDEQASVFMAALTEPAQQAVTQAGYLGQNAHPAGALIWVEVQAADWGRLGARPPHIEIAQTTQAFFDEQTTMMDGLMQRSAEFIHLNPGRPLRVASFRFERVAPGPLLVDWAAKEIEPEVAGSVEASFLEPTPEWANLRAEVQRNVLQTLTEAGQFQWISSNWSNISATHDVYVDVDFYPNRMPDRGGLLHKDSVGETLFVNLTYNNAARGASPEYVVDNVPNAASENDLPQAGADLLLATRAGNVADNGSIRGVDLPARGRVSFIDPAIWHATPLYGRRPPELPFADGITGTYDQIRDYIKKEASLTPAQRASMLLALDGLDGNVTGLEAKTLLRGSNASEPLRYAQRANGPGVDTAPLARRTRARSIDLTNNPEHQERLDVQAGQARSFIRTWVILRRR